MLVKFKFENLNFFGDKSAVIGAVMKSIQKFFPFKQQARFINGMKHVLVASKCTRKSSKIVFLEKFFREF